MSASKHLPVVSVRLLANGNVWLACKERGIGILAGSRQQGLADMKLRIVEFTIRNIEDNRHGKDNHRS